MVQILQRMEKRSTAYFQARVEHFEQQILRHALVSGLAELQNVGGHDLDVEERPQLGHVVVDALVGHALHGGGTDGVELKEVLVCDLRLELPRMLRRRRRNFAASTRRSCRESSENIDIGTNLFVQRSEHLANADIPIRTT